MSATSILAEIEADVETFGCLSTQISAKVKTGIKTLEGILSDVTSLVDTATGKATAAVTSLKSVADQVSSDTTGSASAASEKPAEPGSTTAAPIVTQTATGEVTVDAAAGVSTHVADADGTSTTVDHESGSVVAKDINGNPTQATQAAVDETVNEMTAAGVSAPLV